MSHDFVYVDYTLDLYAENPFLSSTSFRFFCPLETHIHKQGAMPIFLRQKHGISAAKRRHPEAAVDVRI